MKSRLRRALLWCFALAFTGVVAVSRITVGAHFFSDVLMGGTIGFCVCMLSREFFLVDRRHLKALKGRPDGIRRPERNNRLLFSR